MFSINVTVELSETSWQSVNFRIFLVIIFVFALSVFITYPVYLAVHRINRYRDEQTAIYPITMHFYEIVKKVYIFGYSTLFACLVMLPDPRNVEGYTKSGFIYITIYICLNALLIISALLYITIMIHIRNLTFLQDTVQNQPQQFMLYQTLSLALFKVMSLPFFIQFIFGENELIHLLGVSGTIDILSTPLMIQISYLSCNRRTVHLVTSSFFQRVVRPILRSTSSQIEPMR
ncbi:unnamed protein product [Caenorhabditis sp. 36 PRJEB53466]|nr:unnamed protein product [Caenorhabditis sp. 36 PRJEB53466]